MAYTAISICNLALFRAKVRKVVASFIDGSTEAAALLLIWEHVRQDVLRAFDWPFVRVEAIPYLGWPNTPGPKELLRDVTASAEAQAGWEYVYSLPADCLKVRSIWPSTRTPRVEQRIPWEVRYLAAVEHAAAVVAWGNNEGDAVMTVTGWPAVGGDFNINVHFTDMGGAFQLTLGGVELGGGTLVATVYFPLSLIDDQLAGLSIKVDVLPYQGDDYWITPSTTKVTTWCLLTDAVLEEGVEVIYTKDAVNGPWSQEFIEAVVWRLASDLALNLANDSVHSTWCFTHYKQALIEARATALKERQEDPETDGQLVAARG